MSKLEVYLIRHGKTICNENRLYCGKSDIGLSENGIKELMELKAKVKYPAAKKHFTSGAKRANETLEVLYPNKSYNEVKGFTEYDFGDFEMKSYEMLKENQDYISWIKDEEGEIECPNGESKVRYRARVKQEFQDFIKNSVENEYESVLVVCHGGTIGTIMELFYDSSKNYYSWQPKCGLGYKLIVSLEDQVYIESVDEIKV